MKKSNDILVFLLVHFIFMFLFNFSGKRKSTDSIISNRTDALLRHQGCGRPYLSIQTEHPVDVLVGVDQAEPKVQQRRPAVGPVDHIRADRSGSGDRETRSKDGHPQNTA